MNYKIARINQFFEELEQRFGSSGYNGEDISHREEILDAMIGFIRGSQDESDLNDSEISLIIGTVRNNSKSLETILEKIGSLRFDLVRSYQK